MFCPEGYFTPKMLESAFLRALQWETVRGAVFEGAGADVTTFHSSHLDAILETSARYFLFRFILEHRDEIRVGHPTISGINRVDAWATETKPYSAHFLPQDLIGATELASKLDDTFVFIDLEFWVFDFQGLEGIAKPHHEIRRLKVLSSSFDGWSIFMPAFIKPEDVGAAMKAIAKSIPLLNATMAFPPPKRLGRPRKVDAVIEFLTNTYPDSGLNLPRKQLLREAETRLSIECSQTTLSSALREIRSRQK